MTMPREARAGEFRPGVVREHFAVAPDGRIVDAITLTNATGTEVRFLTYGGVIVSLLAADRAGVLDDVTLGYDTLDAYLADTRYLGALVGRYANRIAGGRFTLDGREHRLATNDGANHLHGGRAATTPRSGTPSRSRATGRPAPRSATRARPATRGTRGGSTCG